LTSFAPVGQVEFAVHPHRTARQEHGDRRHAFGRELAQQAESLFVGEAEVLPVTGEFRIGFFAEDHDRGVGFGGIGAIDRQRGTAAARCGSVLEPLPDRGRAGEMFCVREFKPALPGERPSARGLRDAVGRAPGDEDVGTFGQRQHAVVL
jgi:hypothetical protein